jgi:hypothetical protein
MATVHKKTAQLPVLAEPLRVGKIKAWATRSNLAAGEIVRRALWGAGWDALEVRLAAEYGGPLSEAEILAGTLSALPPALRRDFAVKHDLRYEFAAQGPEAE